MHAVIAKLRQTVVRQPKMQLLAQANKCMLPSAGV